MPALAICFALAATCPSAAAVGVGSIRANTPGALQSGPEIPFEPLRILADRDRDSERVAARLSSSATNEVSELHSVQQGDPYAAIDACVRAEMRQYGTPGASLAIAVGGRQVYTQTYGVKHSTLGGTINPDTYFRVNSTTKMMTAAAVMHAAERGYLDLNAPITEYLPELELRAPWAASELTLHGLLSSSDGLPGNYVDLDRTPPSRPPDDTSLLDWIPTLGNMHLFAPPGSFFNYSSASFSLAAAALERATGGSYPELVTENLWRPAGMTRMTMDPEVVIADGDYATGHHAGRHWDLHEYQGAFDAPAGGSYGTPSELLKWAGMLAEEGRGVLAPDSVEAMTTAHIPVANVPITNYAGYGYGIFVEDFRRGGSSERVRVLYHPGNGRGFSTELFWVPETGFSVAILANTVAGLNQSALCALREIEGLTRLPVDRSPLTMPELARLTGTYAMVDTWGNDWTARVWQHWDGSLRIVYSDWSILPTVDELVPEAVMSHRYGQRFRYDAYGSDDALFVDAEPGDPHPRWMEHLSVVGQRAGELPAKVELEGGSCTEVALVPDQTGPGSRLQAHGVLPVYSEKGLPARQDEASRPDSSSFKIGFEAEAEVVYLFTYHWSQADDDVDMYLLHDANGDGRFDYPDELVEAKTGPGAQGFFGRTPMPAGAYQLWMHGRQVRGEDSTFDLDLAVAAGDALELRNVPEMLQADVRHEVELCADLLYSEEPQLGLLTLELADGKRVARVPVRVLPNASRPPTTLYLPSLNPGR
ncbi:MAG: beta-lactamase family protein [Caldilineae bacterium]|nr:beta-lactamase family protein [Caldilineae bacterium]